MTGYDILKDIWKGAMSLRADVDLDVDEATALDFVACRGRSYELSNRFNRYYIEDVSPEELGGYFYFVEDLLAPADYGIAELATVLDVNARDLNNNEDNENYVIDRTRERCPDLRNDLPLVIEESKYISDRFEGDHVLISHNILPSYQNQYGSLSFEKLGRDILTLKEDESIDHLLGSIFEEIVFEEFSPKIFWTDREGEKSYTSHMNRLLFNDELLDDMISDLYYNDGSDKLGFREFDFDYDRVVDRTELELREFKYNSDYSTGDRTSYRVKNF